MDINKLPATIPSALDATMLRAPALLGAGGLPMAPVPLSAAQPPSGPPGLSAAPTMTSLVRALRRRWPVAVTCAILGALLTAAAVFVVMPPKYLAEVRVLVASRPDPGFSALTREDTEFAIYKANLPSLIRAPLNLTSALNQKITPTKLARDLSIVRERGSGALDWLDKAIKTDYNLGPEILRITLSAERNDEVAELLNAVVQSFLYDLEQKDRARAEDLVDQFQKKQEELNQELSRLRRQLSEREKLLNLPGPAEMANRFQIVSTKLAAIEKEHIKNELDKLQARQELDSLIERYKNADAVPVASDELNTVLRADQRFAGLFADLQKAEKNYQEAQRVAPNAAGMYKDNCDRIQKTIDDRLEELRPDLEKSWRAKFRQDLKVAEFAKTDQLKSLDKQAELLSKLVKDARAEVALYTPGIQNVPAEIVLLRETIDSRGKAIGKVTEDIIVLRSNASKSRVTLLQRANEPQDKDVGRQVKFAGAGGFGMFGLILLGIAFLEFRSRKIGAADDVANGLGMTVIGTVPPMPVLARKPLPGSASPYDAYWQGRLMEAIDAIRAVLLHTSRSDSLRVIMVTSAVGGEGKTSLASQLAASLARGWKRTLLIDGDLRNPASHTLFNVPLDPGFSEVLRGDADLAQAVHATPLSRLWTLPAGHWDAQAVQALAQDQVRSMFQSLKDQYDFIIVDSCPVLPVADALLLGQHVDGVLFSVMRDVSRQPAIWAAQQRLQNLGIRTLGAVVIGDPGDDLGAAAYKYALATAATT